MAIPPLNLSGPAGNQGSYLAGQKAAANKGVGTLPNSNTNTGKVFTGFDPVDSNGLSDDIIQGTKTTVTRGLWTGNVGTIATFFTSSALTATQLKYYVNIQNTSSTGLNSETQFAVTYGNRAGSGSYSAGSLNDSTTRAIYSQYRLLLLEPNDNQFTFKTGISTTKNSDDIYVINIERARLRERLDPGNWQVNLAVLTGSNTYSGNNLSPNATSIGTGSQTNGALGYISLMDDSGDTNQIVSTQGGSTKAIYNVVSGTVANGIYNASAPHYYGLVYPEMGMIVLDPQALNQSCSFNTVTASAVEGYNAFKLFYSISGSGALGNGFQARNAEIVTSTNYFVRLKSREYNFSNNPTWATQSTGLIAQPTFRGDPQVYLTTVGLYNNEQQLLAVAKLSKPLLKNFSLEAVIKVQLDF